MAVDSGQEYAATRERLIALQETICARLAENGQPEALAAATKLLDRMKQKQADFERPREQTSPANVIVVSADSTELRHRLLAAIAAS